MRTRLKKNQENFNGWKIAAVLTGIAAILFVTKTAFIFHILTYCDFCNPRPPPPCVCSRNKKTDGGTAMIDIFHFAIQIFNKIANPFVLFIGEEISSTTHRGVKF
jgi:hypothetical protein